MNRPSLCIFAVCAILLLVLSAPPKVLSSVTVEKLVWTEDPNGVMFGTYPREGGATPSKVLEDLGMLPIQRVCWDRLSWIETAPGVYDWSVASFGILEEAHKFGAEAVGSIYMANEIPDFYAQDILDPVTRQAAWDFIYAFTQEMQQRLGKIFVVIDYEMQWYVFQLEGIDPDDWADWYVYLVGAARAAVPGAYVVCDVIADDHDYFLPGNWLTTAMSVSDALGIDDYGLTPQIIHDDIQWFVDNYAEGKPIHILENGFATWLGSSNKAHGTQEEQAAFFDAVIDDITASYAGTVRSYVQFMATDRGTGPGIEDHWGMVTYNYESEKPSLSAFRAKVQEYPAVVLQSTEDVTDLLSGGQGIELTFTDGVNYEGLRVCETINLSSVTRVSLDLEFTDEDGTGGYVIKVNDNWKYCNSPVSNITSFVQHGFNEIEVYFPQQWFPGTVTVSALGLDLMTVESCSHDDFELYVGEADLLAEWTATELAANGLEAAGGETVYEGQQSMRIEYDLTPGDPYYGMVSHDLNASEDWTGFDHLRIAYRGEEGNSTEKLRLRLVDGSGGVFLSKQKISATAQMTWNLWEISLADAPWDQLSDVRTVQIQVAAQECGSGVVYLDDFSLIVPPDEFPPTLSAAGIIGPRKMKVTFGERVNPATAENTDHYLIDDGGTPVQSVTVDEDSMTVTLKIAGVFNRGTCYALRVMGIEDLSGNLVEAGVGDSLEFCYEEDVEGHGDLWSSVEEETVIALKTGLVSVYPNPFNPAAGINYELAGDGQRVTLEVFNVLGQRVRTLVEGARPPGRYTAMWDGRDDYGIRVGAGVYFCRFRAGGVEESRRLVLIK